MTCSDSSIDVTASITKNKVYLHAVNTHFDHSLNLPLKVAGRRIVSAYAWEISADPWMEITGLDPHCFEPRKRQIDVNTYRLPPAGVAALELSLETPAS